MLFLYKNRKTTQNKPENNTNRRKIQNILLFLLTNTEKYSIIQNRIRIYAEISPKGRDFLAEVQQRKMPKERKNRKNKGAYLRENAAD